MKRPKHLIEKFCYEHPNFGIPNLMKYIAIGSAAVWFLCMINPQTASYVVFSPYHVLHGQLWRVVTFLLYPPSTGFFGLIACYFYYWIGSTLEQHWGTAQFNVFYFSGAAITVVYGLLMQLLTGSSVTLTSTYLYLSMFLAFAMLFPDLQVLFMFFIPIKMKWLALVDAIFFVLGILGAVFSRAPLALVLLPIAAIANFLIFFGEELVRGVKRSRPSAGTVNFRRASREIRRQQETQLYRHKCAVCGKTDRDDPTMEFRYCSRCVGYHCFCADHIYQHIHFTN